MFDHREDVRHLMSGAASLAPLLPLPDDSARKAGALQNAILTSASFSFIATDEAGIIQLFNVGAEHVFGYRAGEVVNRLSPSDFHDPEEVVARARALSAEFDVTIAPGFEALAYKASRGIEDIYELTCVHRDGSRFPALISITALRDEAEAIIGYLLIGSDNSARKRVESDLLKAMSEADAANRAKTDFLAGMSHELRTPLNAILGFAQLLESGSPAPTAQQQRSLGHILKAGWYLLELINEILDLAMIESGKVRLSHEPVALAEVLQECRAMVEPQATSRGITLDFAVPAADVFIMADRMRLKQVFVNLLFNAIKYNRPAGTVTVICEYRPAGAMRIGVRDTGAGLSPEQLDQLFQPFNRLGKEAGPEEGTGIGLVMTRRLVELMGGAMGVISTLGSGSTFWVDLALIEAPRLALSALAGEHAEPPTATATGPLRTLLYVEDNPANLDLVEQLIARRPELRLMSVTSAELGIAYAREHVPEIILMDINLPGMSGLEAMRILRADPLTAHIPIIALSANAIARDIERAIAAGFADYLTKPIKVQHFMSAIDASLIVARSTPGMRSA